MTRELTPRRAKQKVETAKVEGFWRKPSLTQFREKGNIGAVQVTIEIPDQVARRLEGQKARLAEIIDCGLKQQGDARSPHWREVIEFLATGPSPEQIIALRPSEATTERSKALLDKNRESQLSELEEAELDEMEQVNNFMTALKLEARKALSARRTS